MLNSYYYVSKYMLPAKRVELWTRPVQTLSSFGLKHYQIFFGNNIRMLNAALMQTATHKKPENV